MPITVEQGILKWASEWAKLKAWRRDLGYVKVTVSTRSFPERAGTCWPFQHRLIVYKGPFVHQLKTLVHEFAHAATIGEGHGAEWQVIYSNAITEITGVPMVSAASKYEDIDTAAYEAISLWWKRSGNDRFWRMAHGK